MAQPMAEDKTLTAEKLYLVDGSGFIFRAYHSLPPLTNPQGTPVGAVYGFTNMLLKLVDEIEADHIAVIFDHARKNFRHEIYADYKANRPEPPEDLIPQFALVREATEALNLPAIEVEGFEADDLIASYAKAGREKGYEVVIVSSDKDLMQLVGDGVTMFDPMKNKTIGPEQVMEKFGVTPDKVIEVQALIGDSSDNVPGVPGIGPKTAAQLIEEYGDLEGVLSQAEGIKQKKRREMLIEHANLARISKELVTLKPDVPLPAALDVLDVKDPEAETVLNWLQAQGFKTLAARMKQHLLEQGQELVQLAEDDPLNAVTVEATDYSLVQTKAQLDAWLAEIREAGMVGFDVETTSLNAMQAELVGLSFATKPGRACYIPVAHQTASDGDLLSEGQEALPQLVLEEILPDLKSVLEDDSILKIGQNIKYDMLIMKKYGIAVGPVDDTMLISYLLDGSLHRHGLDALSERHLGVTPISFKQAMENLPKGATFADVPLEKACDYAAEDADLTLRLHQLLKPRLQELGMVALYERIERPLIATLVTMEYNGVAINPKILQGLSRDFAVRMEALEKEIHAIAGREFTIGSPKQLGEILFEDLGIAGGKKSKSGAYTTSATVLEKLAAEGHDIAQKVLQWRQVAKLRSTYTEALQKQIHPQTGRVHTSYAMTVTSTGRLSSTDPNLQNIPIRSEEGRHIRQAFVAKPGCTLLSADYSQIELRLLAHMAEIEPLQQAFREERDIHSMTAHQVLGMPLDAVDDDARRKAKTINFGIIYGISAFGLAERLGIGRKEAADYIDAYFEQYPGIRRYMERTKEQAREQGYVQTLFGRRCYTLGIQDKNPNMRQFAERAAINAPLQGTAADIIKKAMNRVCLSLNEAGLSQSLLLQVHDELVLEVPDERLDDVSNMVKRTMESVVALSVPLTVSVGQGPNWDASH